MFASPGGTACCCCKPHSPSGRIRRPFDNAAAQQIRLGLIPAHPCQPQFTSLMSHNLARLTDAGVVHQPASNASAREAVTSLERDKHDPSGIPRPGIPQGFRRSTNIKLDLPTTVQGRRDRLAMPRPRTGRHGADASTPARSESTCRRRREIIGPMADDDAHARRL